MRWVVATGADALVADWVLGEGAELELLNDDEELGGGVDTTGAEEARWTGRCRVVRFLVAALRRGRSPADLLCRTRSSPPAVNRFASVRKTVVDASGEISAAAVIALA